MKIVFLDRETFPPEAEFPKPSFEHELIEHPYTSPAETAERIKDADIIVVNKVSLNADNLANVKSLKMIALTATGSNNLDIKYCRNNNIVVSNIRDYGARSVAEHALALIFALRRDLIAYNDMIRAGSWQESRQFVMFSRPIADLSDNVLAIAGRGNIGITLAKLGEMLGMKIIYAEHPKADKVRGGYVDFYEALTECDVLSLHCPLTEDNAKMMGKEEFATMKKSAILINTARGALIDEQALADALRDGEIGGAGLDVLDGEPPRPDNPLLRIGHQSNLIITPHTAWISKEALELAISQTMENIEAFATAKPIRTL